MRPIVSGSIIGLSVLLASCLLAVRAGAVTWTVLAGGRGTSPTIQAAIDFAADGDTVSIGPGTFNERVSIVDKTLLVTGAGRDVTIINGYPFTLPHRNTIAIRGFGNYTTVRSLTIRDGVTYAFGDVTGGIYGAGVLGDGAVFALVDCRVTNCSAMSLGGGLYATSQRIAPGEGEIGAMPPRPAAPPPWPFIEHDTILIRDCLFDGNIAGAEGGGFCLEFAYFRIENCTFRDNYTGDGGGGRIFNSIGVMENCLVWNNEVVLDGGGLDTEQNIPWEGTSILIRNNTIVGNRASREGSAVFITSGITIDYERNIFALNGGGANSVVGCRLPDGEYHGSCNHFWMNAGETFTECQPLFSDTSGDPLFCSPETGDFRLCASSPLLSPVCGMRGALGVGCDGVDCSTATVPMTWGGVKSFFR
jgi:hypothetical protein